MAETFVPPEPSDSIAEFKSFDDFRMRIYFMFLQSSPRGVHNPIQTARIAAEYTEAALLAYQTITQPKPGESTDDVR